MIRRKLAALLCVKPQTMTRIGMYSVTAYSLPGRTASGAATGPGCLAAPPSISFGTELYVEGYGFGVVLDRGGMVGEGCLDIWLPTDEECFRWGRRLVGVWQ